MLPHIVVKLRWFSRTAAHISAVGDVLLPPATEVSPGGAPPSVLIADDALQRYVAADVRTVSAARVAVTEAAEAAAESGGRVRRINFGAELLEACPTLRSLYCTKRSAVQAGVLLGPDPDTADGLSALRALMRDEQAGEIYVL